MSEGGVDWVALGAALTDFQAFPGRHALVLREPAILFEHTTDILSLAAGRGVEGLPADAELEAHLREAARFFVRVALLRQGADHFTVLGLTPGFDPATLRDHYRMLIRLTHPDFSAEGAAWPADAATRINLANDVLSSDDRRAAYVQTLNRPVPRPPTPVPRRWGPARDQWSEAGPKRWPAVAVGAAVVALLGVWLWPSQTPQERLAKLAQASEAEARAAAEAASKRVASEAAVALAAPPTRAVGTVPDEGQTPSTLQLSQTLGGSSTPVHKNRLPETSKHADAEAASGSARAPMAAARRDDTLRDDVVAAIRSVDVAPRAAGRPAVPVTPQAKGMPPSETSRVRSGARENLPAPVLLPTPALAMSALAATPPSAPLPVPAPVVRAPSSPPVAAPASPAQLTVATGIAVPPPIPPTPAPAAVAAPVAPPVPVAAVVPTTAAVITSAVAATGRAPRMADIQPLLGQLLGALQSGRGEVATRLVDGSARGAGSEGFARAYDRTVAGARILRVGPVKFAGRSVGDQLVVDGVVQLQVQTQDDVLASGQRDLVLGATFAYRGGRPVMTGLTSGDGGR